MKLNVGLADMRVRYTPLLDGIKVTLKFQHRTPDDRAIDRGVWISTSGLPSVGIARMIVRTWINAGFADDPHVFDTGAIAGKIKIGGDQDGFRMR